MPTNPAVMRFLLVGDFGVFAIFIALENYAFKWRCYAVFVASNPIHPPNGLFGRFRNGFAMRFLSIRLFNKR